MIRQAIIITVSITVILASIVCICYSYINPKNKQVYTPKPLVIPEYVPDLQELNVGEAVYLGVDSIILKIDCPYAYIEDKKTTIDNLHISPYTNNKRTMVPLRFIARMFGSTTIWYDSVERIDIFYNRTCINLHNKSCEMCVDGRTIELDAPPEIKYKTVFVPLRAISEGFGKKVFYYEDLISVQDDPESLFNDPEFVKKANEALRE